MNVLREEWFENNFYTITTEDSVICFSVIKDRSENLLYYELDDLNIEYFVKFSMESFYESINKLDVEFYALLIDTIIDAYHYRVAIGEAYILIHQLFAKGYRFEKEAELGVDEIGHTLGLEDDFFSIELKFGSSLHNKYLFHKSFYHVFFSTEISQDFTVEILSKIPQKDFFDKIYSYYIQNDFDKADPYEIEKVLKRTARKEKINSIFSNFHE